MQGLVELYYGNGKGKTTAAVGLAVRAVGAGLKVYFARFLKDDAGNELKLLKTSDKITVAKAPHKLPFFFRMTEDEKRKYIAFAREVFADIESAAARREADIFILDEIIDAVDLKIIGKDELIAFIKSRPPEVELVLTGHNLDGDIADCCDYVSEVRAVKHPFDRGVAAREGIEF